MDMIFCHKLEDQLYRNYNEVRFCEEGVLRESPEQKYAGRTSFR